MLVKTCLKLQLPFHIPPKYCNHYLNLLICQNHPFGTIKRYTLREKYPYSEFFWSVFSRIQSECGKIQTRKTQNTDTFHAVTYIHFEQKMWQS